MLAGNEVGKVSLGIEFTGDINKQVASVADMMGQRLAKALGTSFKGARFGAAMKDAVKETNRLDVAMKKTALTIKAAGQWLNKLKSSMKSVALPKMPASVVTPSEPAVKPKAPKAKPAVDVEAARAEIEHLTAVLDNINARLELQQRKLADLRESYKNTFNEAKKNKLQEEILKTEAAILRLTKQSDKTASQIWKLEDSLKDVKEEAESTGSRFSQFVKRLLKFNLAFKRANKTLNQTDKQLKATAKSAGRTNRALAATGKSANKMGNQFTQAFRRIAKQVLIFSVIYKAIRGLQNYIGSSLRTNNEYVKSLNAIKTNLAVAFQPIYDAILPAINALMAGLAKVTAYIAAFVSALFGKTYKQSYDAAKGLHEARKAMDGYGKSAQKAANSLASFDELNVLDTSSGDDAAEAGPGGAAWDMQMPELDIDGIQSQVDTLVLGIRSTFDRAFSMIRSGWQSMVTTFGPSLQTAGAIIQPELLKWKEMFGAMFADILTLGEPLKNWWQNSVMPLWHESVANMSMIFTGLSASVRNVFDSIWQSAFPIIEKFVSDGLPRITEFAQSVQYLFMGMFSVIKQIFDDIWQDVVDPVLQIISQIIRDTLDLLFGWWDDWGKKIVANIRESLDRIKELWDNLWNKMLRPIVTKMLDTLTKLWNDHLKGLLKEIGNFIGKLITAAQDIFNKFVLPIANWLIKTLGPAFSEVFDLATTVIGTALGAVIDAAKGIIKALGGIVEFIAGVFTLDWKRAWNGIVDFFRGIGDAIISVFKGAVNVIIDAMNWLIRQLNKVKIDLPGWVEDLTGVGSFGINIPEIPRLAKGGLVTAPTLAMVGDNPHANVDPEVVAPLSKLQEMLGGAGSQEVVEVLYMILSALQDYARRPVILEANGTQLAKVIDSARDDRARRAGRTLGIV